jgi:hypothetical protein
MLAIKLPALPPALTAACGDVQCLRPPGGPQGAAPANGDHPDQVPPIRHAAASVLGPAKEGLIV